MPEHLLPEQHGPPAWPQVEHTYDEVLHTSPSPRQTYEYELLLVDVVVQQASPALFPQDAHTPLEHLVPDAVQSVPVETLVLVLVEQQGLPGPPHEPELQLPSLQVPCSGRQLAPLATQTLEAQHPLSEQVLPEQQTWPGPPHEEPLTVVPPEPPLADPPVPLSAPPAPLPPVPGSVEMLVLTPPLPPRPEVVPSPPSGSLLPP